MINIKDTIWLPVCQVVIIVFRLIACLG